MKTDFALGNHQVGTNLMAETSLGFARQLNDVYPGWEFHWRVQDNRSEPVASGQLDYLVFRSRIVDLLKLERQHRERLAAIALDTVAQGLLHSLDRETSIRWEDLPAKAEGDWAEVCRSAALLAGANLCDVGPTRLRLSEYGDKFLTESAQARMTKPAVES